MAFHDKNGNKAVFGYSKNKSNQKKIEIVNRIVCCPISSHDHNKHPHLGHTLVNPEQRLLRISGLQNVLLNKRVTHKPDSDSHS